MDGDYYPFGMLVPNRHNSAESYRYGFNGMEKDDEIKGFGNSYTTEFRQYDPLIGRWFSPDPLQKQLPWQSPYLGMDNKPIIRNDIDGDCSTCLTGAIVGALLEVTLQIGEQMYEGKDLKSAFSKVDWLEVSAQAGLGALSGAFTCGIGKLTTTIADPKKRQILEKVLELGADYIIEKIEESLDTNINKGALVVNFYNKTGIDLGISKLTPKEIGNAGEAVTKEILDKAYAKKDGYAVLEQVSGKFSDGSGKVFDFVVLDKDGNVVQTIETKANTGRFTKKQRDYYKEGKEVELQLEGRKDTEGRGFKNKKINKKDVDAKVHRVKIDSETGKKTKSTFKKIR